MLVEILALINSSFRFLGRLYATKLFWGKHLSRIFEFEVITSQCFFTMDVTLGKPGWKGTTKTCLSFSFLLTFLRASSLFSLVKRVKSHLIYNLTTIVWMKWDNKTPTIKFYYNSLVYTSFTFYYFLWIISV